MSFETDITVIMAGLTDDNWIWKKLSPGEFVSAFRVVKHASLHNLSCSFSFSFREGNTWQEQDTHCFYTLWYMAYILYKTVRENITEKSMFWRQAFIKQTFVKCKICIYGGQYSVVLGQNTCALTRESYPSCASWHDPESHCKQKLFCR